MAAADYMPDGFWPALIATKLRYGDLHPPFNRTPEGRTFAHRHPDYLLEVSDSINMTGVQTLGLYAVLGQYDFVTVVEAPNNETMAPSQSN